MKTNRLLLIAALCLSLLLTGCGGDSGDGTIIGTGGGGGDTNNPINAEITSIEIVQISPGSLLAATGSADVTVTVIGTDGLPLQGATPYAAVTGGATLTAQNIVTDSNGEMTVRVTGTTAENVVLSFRGGAEVAQEIFNFGPTITLSPGAVTARGEATLSAVLRDANRVAMSGVPINFFTTYLVAADEDNLVTGSSPTTNASGIATVTIADTVGNGGEVVINAADVNDEILSNDATVTFQAESASFALSADVSLPVVSAGCLCRGNHDDFCHSSFGSGRSSCSRAACHLQYDWYG